MNASLKKLSSFVVFACFGLSLSLTVQLPAQAEQEESNTAPIAQVEVTQGFISDELFIYMLAGSGKNYRILGTVTAGAEIKLTGIVQNDYTQIINEKNRTAWVETKYISKKPGLRFVVAELNAQIATATDLNKQLDSQLNNVKASMTNMNDKSSQLNNEIAALKNQLASTKAKLKTQDTDIQKQWFFNGAIVLGIGLILGLVLPRLGGKRKSSIDNWK